MKVRVLVITVLIILCSSLALAQLSVRPSPVFLGDALRGVNFTSNTFNVTNTGATALSSVSITSDAASRYRLRMNTSSIATLGAGSTVTVSYNISIPTDEAIGNRSLASLNVSAGTLANSTSFIANVKGRLNINDVDVTVDGQGSANLRDGQKITKEARPRSQVKFEVNLENLFNKAQHNIDIEDVQVSITIEEIDDDDDVELESGTFDIRAGNRKAIELAFDVPEKTAEGDYTVRILAEGQTDEDADEEQEITLTLEVEKQSHDIHFIESKLTPTTISCQGVAKLDLSVANVGDEDERLAYILVESPQLKYRAHAGEIELLADPDDEENTASRNFSMIISQGTQPGSYAIEARVFDDNNDVRDYVKHLLTVQSCDQQTQGQGQTVQNQTNTQPRQTPAQNDTQTVIPVITQPQPEQNVNLQAFRNSPLYLPALGLLALIVFFAILIAIIRMRK